MKRWLCLACLCASPALADEGRSYWSERPADFTLALTQHDLDLVREGDRIDTTLRRIGIAWREHYGDRVALGLLGGYSYVTQSGEPLTAGEQLDGYHLGASVDVDLPLSSFLSLYAGARYLYERTSDENDRQEVTLSWNQVYAEAGLAFRAGRAARFHAGVNYGELDGEERARGTVIDTRDLSVDDHTGVAGGVEVTVDRDGYVGAVARSGAYRGAGIYFGRRF